MSNETDSRRREREGKAIISLAKEQVKQWKKFAIDCPWRRPGAPMRHETCGATEQNCVLGNCAVWHFRGLK